MAVMQSRDNRTFIAGEDLSAAQFKFVTLESDGQIDLADADAENCIGVCIVGAAAGAAATVTVSGKTMVTAGGTIDAGEAIVTDASGDAVALTDSSSATAITMGYALEAGVDGQIIAIELIQGGNASDQS